MVRDRTPVCAVFMPMLFGYDAIRAAVKDATETAGVVMRRLEDLLPDHEWQLWVARSAESADLVLADVTDNNPFVMYELGVAHAHRSPSLVIVNNRNHAVPATVKGSFFLSYDDDHLSEFVPRLAKAIQRSLRLQWRPAQQIPAAEIYAKRMHLFKLLPREAYADWEVVSEEEFLTLIEVAWCRGEIPFLKGDVREYAEILLARLVKSSDCCDLMDMIERQCEKARQG